MKNVFSLYEKYEKNPEISRCQTSFFRSVNDVFDNIKKDVSAIKEHSAISLEWVGKT